MSTTKLVFQHNKCHNTSKWALGLLPEGVSMKSFVASILFLCCLKVEARGAFFNDGDKRGW